MSFRVTGRWRELSVRSEHIPATLTGETSEFFKMFEPAVKETGKRLTSSLNDFCAIFAFGCGISGVIMEINRLQGYTTQH